jgi:predicted Zn-dependent peptidase
VTPQEIRLMRTSLRRALAASLPLLATATATAARTASAQGPQGGTARQAPPPPAAPKEFRLPAKRTFTLPNGMRVTLVPFGKVPKANVSLALRTGNIDEGPSEVWLADLTGELLTEGAGSRSAEQIAHEMAGMGGELDVSVGVDQTTVGGSVLAERTPDFVRLVADVARAPTFPSSELERVKADLLRQLAIEKSQPRPVAEEKFSQILYGDHPYGRPYPTEPMLQGYTLDQVRGFHRSNYGALRAHLYVAGVFDQQAVERSIREAFGGWERGRAPTVNPPKPKQQRSATLLDRPDAVQSTLYLGLPVPDPSSADYAALSVTNSLLGGSFGSRITTNIREQKGYTYSPFSQLATHYRDAYWVEIADVTTNVTGASLKEIFGEIDRLRDTAPPAPELRGIQNNMVGVFTLQNSSRGGIINQLQFVGLHGLGDDYLTGYARRVLAITPQDVQRITRDYLRPDRMTLVVVGDRKQVEAQLAPFMPVVP